MAGLLDLIRHMRALSPGDIIRSLLASPGFLHKSAQGTDPQIVKLILDAYPQAAAEVDHAGKLPLHCAAEWGRCQHIVKLILDAHPQAAAEVDAIGRLPFHCAVEWNWDLRVEQLLRRAAVRVIRWPSSAKIIQRAWRKRRYNPA